MRGRTERAGPLHYPPRWAGDRKGPRRGPAGYGRPGRPVGENPSPPPLNFSDSDRSLFTPADIRRLMRIEYERAVRYGIPMSLLVIEVDRLGSLRDLYGVESAREILRGVVDLLRTVTRDHDVVGCLEGDRILALFPHTTEAGAAAIANRLLEGARGLGFQSDGRSLQITLAVGFVPLEGEPEGGFEEFLEAAEEALLEAVETGGDCVVEGALPETEAPPPPPPSEAVPAPPPALPRLEELPPGPLEDQIRALFRGLGGRSAESLELEERVIEIARAGLRTVQEQARGSQEEEVRILERRVAKLHQMLEATEEELQRLVQEKSVDPGLQSIYRTVQGLSPESEGYEKKKDILGLLYQANVELLRKLKSGA